MEGSIPNIEKEKCYIYGNHDSKEKCDSRVNLFSIKSLEKYIFHLPNQIYIIEHGHKILDGEKGKLLEIYSSVLKKTEKSPFRNVIYKLLHNLEYLGYKYIGMKLMTQSKVAQNNNKIIKKSKHKGFLICGDTHCAEIDKINMFANSGTINYGFASYLLITDESVELNKRNY